MNNQNNETKEYTLTDEELNTVCGGISSRTPGISCPVCGKFIPTSIFDLLNSDRIRCPYCLLKLKINRTSLETLKKQK